MDDIPPSVAIVFMVCIAIITATIVVCDCAKQKYAAPDNVVTSTESTTGIGVSTTESTTENPTETDDTSAEDMTPAQYLLFM